MDTDSFFNSFIQTEDKTKETRAKKTSSKPAEYFNPKIGGVYIFGLIPTLPVEFEVVSFKSRVNGSYQFLGLSPESLTLGENAVKKNPISKRLWTAWAAVKNSNDKEAQSEALQLVAKIRKVMNIHLFSDSLDPANNGVDKVWEFAAGFNSKSGLPTGNIWKKLHSALQGNLMETYGAKLFDLGPDGFNIMLTVSPKKIGEQTIPEYSVDFIPRKKSEALSQAKIKEILANAYDLKKYIPELKSNQELEEILSEHWDGNPISKEVDTLESASSQLASSESDDDFDFGAP